MEHLVLERLGGWGHGLEWHVSASFSSDVIPPSWRDAVSAEAETEHSVSSTPRRVRGWRDKHPPAAFDGVKASRAESALVSVVAYKLIPPCSISGFTWGQRHVLSVQNPLCTWMPREGNKPAGTRAPSLSACLPLWDHAAGLQPCSTHSSVLPYSPSIF